MERSTMTKSWRLGAPLLALLLLAGACGDDGSSEPEDASGSSSEPAAETVDITVTADGYELPESIPGVATVTLTNESDNPVDAQFVGIGDTPVDQFVEDFTPVVEEGAAFPEYVEGAAGTPLAEPGQSVTNQISLQPGRYAVFASEGEFTPETVAEVEVTEGEGEVSGDSSIVALDYEFELDLSAGEQTVAVTNEGPGQFHHAILQQFPEGTSEQDARAAVETFFSLGENEAPPPGTPEPQDLAASAVFAPGDAGTFDVSLDEGGTYFVACFISDREGGPPHAVAYDMWDVFTLEG
jgi:hypothetical protein